MMLRTTRPDCQFAFAPLRCRRGAACCAAVTMVRDGKGPTPPMDPAATLAQVLDAMRVQIAVLAFAAAAGLVLMRRPRLAAACLAAGSAIGLSVLRQGSLGTTTAAGPTCDPVRIVAANVYDGNAAFDDALAMLMGLEADLLVLVEVPVHRKVEALSRISLDYPHARDVIVGRRVILAASRHRVEAVAGPPPRNEHPGHLVLDVVEGPIAGTRLLAMHFTSPFSGRQGGQVRDLPRFGGIATRPMIVIGDFNAPPWSGLVTAVGRVTGTRRHPSLAATWSPLAQVSPWFFNPLTGLAIDHVLTSSDLRVGRVDRHVTPGSDHLAQIIEVCGRGEHDARDAT